MPVNLVSENVLVLGATSDIATALASQFAAKGFGITLAARDEKKLPILAADLNIRYNVPVYTVYFDALDFKSHQPFYASLNPKPTVVICVFGFLGNQQIAEQDWNHAALILDSNFTGAVSILSVVANDFEQKQDGIIVGISSVAGERGRQSNYFYGSAKAGFTAFLSGLRNRLHKNRVHVLTVKPGFMKTKMIEGLKTPGPLTASPEVAAKRIFKAVKSRKNVVYVLPIWWLVMMVIRNIPEGIFKKLKL